MKINGFEYAWEDVQCVMMGRVIETLSEITYTTKKDHSNGYGRGDKPIYGKRGRKEYDGQIVMAQSDVEALQLTLPKGKDLTDLKPFPLVVSYAPDGGSITTDQLEFCRIKEIGKSFKEGDGNMMVTLPLAIGNIKYNV